MLGFKTQGLSGTKIMSLLVEASICDGRRANQIQSEFRDAMTKSRILTDRSAGINVLVESIYIQLRQNSPALLPTMYPLFATACGIREDKYIIADIDWSIYGGGK